MYWAGGNSKVIIFNEFVKKTNPSNGHRISLNYLFCYHLLLIKIFILVFVYYCHAKRSQWGDTLTLTARLQSAWRAKRRLVFFLCLHTLTVISVHAPVATEKKNITKILGATFLVPTCNVVGGNLYPSPRCNLWRHWADRLWPAGE